MAEGVVSPTDLEIKPGAVRMSDSSYNSRKLKGRDLRPKAALGKIG